MRDTLMDNLLAGLLSGLRDGDVSPVFDLDLSAAARVDLSVNNPAVAGLSGDHVALQAVIDGQLLRAGASVGWGGYLERRDLYDASPAFNDGREEPRSLHLGIDVWAPAGTEVRAPLDGSVHSLAYNDAVLDYGGTILVEHEREGVSFVTLYGHLSRGSLDGLERGAPVRSGQALAHLGDPTENGGWPPHLHFQVIADIGAHVGDFPGACKPSEVETWRRRCPDPAPLLGLVSRPA